MVFAFAVDSCCFSNHIQCYRLKFFHVPDIQFNLIRHQRQASQSAIHPPKVHVCQLLSPKHFSNCQKIKFRLHANINATYTYIQHNFCCCSFLLSFSLSFCWFFFVTSNGTTKSIHTQHGKWRTWHANKAFTQLKHTFATHFSLYIACYKKKKPNDFYQLGSVQYVQRMINLILNHLFARVCVCERISILHITTQLGYKNTYRTSIFPTKQ